MINELKDVRSWDGKASTQEADVIKSKEELVTLRSLPSQLPFPCHPRHPVPLPFPSLFFSTSLHPLLSLQDIRDHPFTPLGISAVSWCRDAKCCKCIIKSIQLNYDRFVSETYTNGAGFVSIVALVCVFLSEEMQYMCRGAATRVRLKSVVCKEAIQKAVQ